MKPLLSLTQVRLYHALKLYFVYENAMNISDAFRGLLYQASVKYTQKEVANLIGVSESTISLWYKQYKIPRNLSRIKQTAKTNFRKATLASVTKCTKYVIDDTNQLIMLIYQYAGDIAKVSKIVKIPVGIIHSKISQIRKRSPDLLKIRCQYPQCENIFIPRRINQRFCSHICRNRFKHKKHNFRLLMGFEICKKCKKIFEPKSHNMKYCTEICKIKSREIL